MSASSSMSGASTAQELDGLLSEPPDAARARAAGRLRWLDPTRHKLILFGAGTTGKAVLAGLRKSGIEPTAFADDTPSKQGQAFNGVPIMQPQQAISWFGADIIFVVTILNPALSYRQAK